MKNVKLVALIMLLIIILPSLSFADYETTDLYLGYTDGFQRNVSLQYRFARFIANPFISSLLLTIGFAGLIIEIMTPGFGIGGTISILSFGLFFGGNIMIGNSNWSSLALFTLGLVLLIIEVVVPGFGIPGISGIIFVVVGVVLAMDSVINAILSISMAIIITTIIGIVLFKRGFDTKIFKSIILTNEHKKEKGYVSSAVNEDLISKKGTTLTELRPSGFIDIDGDRLDVLSEDGYINKDVIVEVIRIEGSKIFVRRG